MTFPSRGSAGKDPQGTGGGRGQGSPGDGGGGGRRGAPRPAPRRGGPQPRPDSRPDQRTDPPTSSPRRRSDWGPEFVSRIFRGFRRISGADFLTDKTHAIHTCKGRKWATNKFGRVGGRCRVGGKFGAKFGAKFGGHSAETRRKIRRNIRWAIRRKNRCKFRRKIRRKNQREIRWKLSGNSANWSPMGLVTHLLSMCCVCSTCPWKRSGQKTNIN